MRPPHTAQGQEGERGSGRERVLSLRCGSLGSVVALAPHGPPLCASDEGRRRLSRERGPLFSATRAPPPSEQSAWRRAPRVLTALWPEVPAWPERRISILPLLSDEIRSDVQETVKLLRPRLRIFLTGRCISRLRGAAAERRGQGVTPRPPRPLPRPLRVSRHEPVLCWLQVNTRSSLFIFGYRTFNFSKSM